MSVLSSDIFKRVFFGVLLAALALFCTVYSPLTFHALLLIVAMLAYKEWLELTREMPWLHKFGGLAYIGLPVWSLIALRGTGNPDLVINLFAMVWATDIAAYLGGKTFGKHQLAPTISPAKTWEGLGCGIAAAAVTGLVAALLSGFPASPVQGVVIGIALGCITQVGDLMESMLKRRAGVKDSSHLIPGHGGVLDRIDGLIFAAPVYALLVLMSY